MFTLTYVYAEYEPVIRVEIFEMIIVLKCWVFFISDRYTIKFAEHMKLRF